MKDNKTTHFGFKKVPVDLKRVGFKFGTFVPTRKFVKKLKSKK